MRPVPGQVGNVANTVVVNWFLMSAYNHSGLSVGVSVGQKYGDCFRLEGGVPAVRKDSNEMVDYTFVLGPGLSFPNT